MRPTTPAVNVGATTTTTRRWESHRSFCRAARLSRRSWRLGKDVVESVANASDASTHPRQSRRCVSASAGRELRAIDSSSSSDDVHERFYHREEDKHKEINDQLKFVEEKARKTTNRVSAPARRPKAKKTGTTSSGKDKVVVASENSTASYSSARASTKTNSKEKKPAGTRERTVTFASRYHGASSSKNGQRRYERANSID